MLKEEEILKQSYGQQLPLELNNATLFVYQEERTLIVEKSDSTLKVRCNLKYSICTFELSGWYYGKTAGLLGTISNEKYDDMLSSYGHVENNISNFAHSWSLEEKNDNNVTDDATVFVVSHDQFSESIIKVFCANLFLNKSSRFNLCFTIIEPADFYRICLNSNILHEVCTVASAYLQTCAFHNIYLRIPDNCTSCSIDHINEFDIHDGDFRKLESKYYY